MIYLIFTGGTIGSAALPDGSLNVADTASSLLLRQYRALSGDDCDFSVSQPYAILSENLDGKHLNLLIDAIRRVLRHADCEGILLMHGTDTLQFSAAMLSFLFSDIAVPLLLVSSNFILTDSRANGLSNFAFALRFLREKRGCGVFVSYRNPGGLPQFHRGHLLQNPLALTDEVYSIRALTYGCYEAPSTDRRSLCRAPYRALAGQHAPNASLPFTAPSHLCEHSHILWLKPYVGMTYPPIPDDCRAVLLDSYHSGTIAVSDGLRGLMQEAAERKLPVLLTGLSSDGAEYDSILRYKQLGITPLYDGAPVALYCKLWLAVSAQAIGQLILESG